MQMLRPPAPLPPSEPLRQAVTDLPVPMRRAVSEVVLIRNCWRQEFEDRPRTSSDPTRAVELVVRLGQARLHMGVFGLFHTRPELVTYTDRWLTGLTHEASAIRAAQPAPDPGRTHAQVLQARRHAALRTYQHHVDGVLRVAQRPALLRRLEHALQSVVECASRESWSSQAGVAEVREKAVADWSTVRSEREQVEQVHLETPPEARIRVLRARRRIGPGPKTPPLGHLDELASQLVELNRAHPTSDAGPLLDEVLDAVWELL